jgi:hypothetical protein
MNYNDLAAGKKIISIYPSNKDRGELIFIERIDGEWAICKILYFNSLKTDRVGIPRKNWNSPDYSYKHMVEYSGTLFEKNHIFESIFKAGI